jgi:hypothetical protein
MQSPNRGAPLKIYVANHFLFVRPTPNRTCSFTLALILAHRTPPTSQNPSTIVKLVRPIYQSAPRERPLVRDREVADPRALEAAGADVTWDDPLQRIGEVVHGCRKREGRERRSGKVLVSSRPARPGELDR